MHFTCLLTTCVLNALYHATIICVSIALLLLLYIEVKRSLLITGQDIMAKFIVNELLMYVTSKYTDIKNAINTFYCE